MLMRVAAGGDGTSDRTGFVVVIGQATVLAAVNQHVRSAIRDEASKPKLVLLPCFRSVFFSINLVNVTILRFVVWHYLAYCEKIFNMDWITRWHAEAPGGHCTFSVFCSEHVQFSRWRTLYFFCFLFRTCAVFSLAYYYSFTMVCTDLLQVTEAVGGSKSQLETIKQELQILSSSQWTSENRIAKL